MIVNAGTFVFALIVLVTMLLAKACRGIIL